MLSVSMLVRGTASSHLLVRSMMVKMYRYPSLDVGRGPTKSTWMWENLWVGTGIGCCAAGGWRTTLARLHSWQSPTHFFTSLFIPGHTTLAPSILADAFAQKANLTLNTGPLPDGSVHPADVAALLQAGVRIRRDGYPAPALLDRTKRKKMKKK